MAPASPSASAASRRRQALADVRACARHAHRERQRLSKAGYREWARREGATPVAQVVAVLGSWTAAREAAGGNAPRELRHPFGTRELALPVIRDEFPRWLASQGHRRSYVTREDWLAFRRHRAGRGLVPAPGVAVLRWLFGSFTLAMEAAGLHAGRHTPAELQAACIAHARRLVNELGRFPTTRHWDASNPPWSRFSVYRHFGSWPKFRLAATGERVGRTRQPKPEEGQ